VVDVILPVLNEAAAIPRVVAGLPAGYDALVVDNGSTDGSAGVARSVGARVVNEPVRGFGSACFAGLRAASSDIVCFMDCDGSLRGDELERVVEPVRSRGADLVLGARRATTSAAWPWHARLGNRLVVRMVSRRTGLDLTDLGPMRAARRDQLLELGLVDRRFGWPLEMVVRAQAAGWTIVEVDVPYAERQGRSKVTGTVRGTARTVRDMGRILTSVRAPDPPEPGDT
jgi:glycosyltransferase involved in cell wall biosynthesis